MCIGFLSVPIKLSQPSGHLLVLCIFKKNLTRNPTTYPSVNLARVCWGLWLGILGFELLAWDVWLGILGWGSLAWDLWVGTFGFGS